MPDDKPREVCGIPVPPEFHAEYDEMVARHARERAELDRHIWWSNFLLQAAIVVIAVESVSGIITSAIFFYRAHHGG
jgi:hypothetical protein